MKRNKWHFPVYIALAIVCVIALAAPLYNRDAPRLFGMPFFIWFQIAWVIVAAVATGVAHVAVGDRN